MEEKKLLQRKREYLSYIIKSFRESTTLEQAIGVEFTKTKENTADEMATFNAESEAIPS